MLGELSSFASDGLEQHRDSSWRIDGVVPEPLDLWMGELPHHPPEHGGELRGEKHHSRG